MSTAKEHFFCINCGVELPTSYTVNYCPNCGQAIKKENRIAKYTSDGKPVNSTQGQTEISTKVTDPTPVESNIGKAKEIAALSNTSSNTTNTKCPHCGARGVKLIRAKQYYELCEKCKRAEDEGKISAPSHRNAAIGAFVVIIIIGVIIALVANWLYQSGLETDKLLELGCTPEAWSSLGRVTIWSCPAWRGIDVNDPSTFMNQKP